MLLLLSLAAFGCEEPLEIRTIHPSDSDTDVPLDARVVISFIGWGAAEQYEARLTREGEDVASTTGSWCYEHEGPHEVHCWIRLTPDAPLEAEADYVVFVETTEAWPHADPRSLQARFTTGTESLQPISGAPGLVVQEPWLEADEDCGYPVARRYWLETTTTSGADDPRGLSLFHLYSLDAHGQPGDIIHTIFATNPSEGAEEDEPPWTKQYLDGSISQTDCFRMVEEDGAGSRSEPVDACWEPADTGRDTSPDTAPPDSGEAPPDDTGPADTAHTAPETCGCQSAGWLVLLPLPLVLARRR